MKNARAAEVIPSGFRTWNDAYYVAISTALTTAASPGWTNSLLFVVVERAKLSSFSEPSRWRRQQASTNEQKVLHALPKMLKLRKRGFNSWVEFSNNNLNIHHFSLQYAVTAIIIIKRIFCDNTWKVFWKFNIIFLQIVINRRWSATSPVVCAFMLCRIKSRRRGLKFYRLSQEWARDCFYTE
jgi:hypothetical protein